MKSGTTTSLIYLSADRKYQAAGGSIFFLGFAPWKINMEHINHPFREENDLPNLYDYVPC